MVSLGEADLVRLKTFARYRVQGLGRRACGRTYEDLLAQAIADTLEPEKRRWNKDVTFVTHLFGAMRSISSHWREQFDADEPRLESELERANEEGERLSPLDSAESDSPPADRIVEAQQELNRIGQVIAGDRVVSDILDGMRAGMFPEEIREALELSQTEYETAMKRLRRHVRLKARGGSDG